MFESFSNLNKPDKIVNKNAKAQENIQNPPEGTIDITKDLESFKLRVEIERKFMHFLLVEVLRQGFNL